MLHPEGRNTPQSRIRAGADDPRAGLPARGGRGFAAPPTGGRYGPFPLSAGHSENPR
jgi:hypothetical protein